MLRWRSDAIQRVVAAGERSLRRGEKRIAKRLYSRAHELLRYQITAAQTCVRSGSVGRGEAYGYVVPVVARFERFERRVEG